MIYRDSEAPVNEGGGQVQKPQPAQEQPRMQQVATQQLHSPNQELEEYKRKIEKLEADRAADQKFIEQYKLKQKKQQRLLSQVLGGGKSGIDRNTLQRRTESMRSRMGEHQLMLELSRRGDLQPGAAKQIARIIGPGRQNRTVDKILDDLRSTDPYFFKAESQRKTLGSGVTPSNVSLNVSPEVIKEARDNGFSTDEEIEHYITKIRPNKQKLKII